MKKTAISVKSFTIAMLQGVLALVLLVGIIGAASVTTATLGDVWGVYSIVFYTLIAIWFYFHNMKGVKAKVKEHLDAFFATVGSFIGTVLVVWLGMLVSTWISSTAGNTVGWLTFGVSIILMIICYIRSHTELYEEQESV